MKTKSITKVFVTLAMVATIMISGGCSSKKGASSAGRCGMIENDSDHNQIKQRSTAQS